MRRSKTDPEGRGTVLYLAPHTMRDLTAIRPEDATEQDAIFGLLHQGVSDSFSPSSMVVLLRMRGVCVKPDCHGREVQNGHSRVRRHRALGESLTT